MTFVLPVLQNASIDNAWKGRASELEQNPMTFCIIILSSLLMKVSTHEVGGGVLHTDLYSALQVSQALRSQLLREPYKGVETPCLSDKGPNILGGQIQVSRILPSWEFREYATDK